MKTLEMIHGATGNCDFAGMQQCPAPRHLVEKRASLIPGMENVWYEYLPESYDPNQSYPLIVQLHGGGMDGKRWASMTTWHLLAEAYGLIVIYPNSPDYQTWMLGSRDVQYLYDLIQRVTAAYAVDKSRIFMQGMSNGDQMALAFSMKHPEVLAAAGFATGPTADYLLEDGETPAGPLPVIQMRGEKDVIPGGPGEGETGYDIYALRYAMNDLNRELWVAPNGLKHLPALTVRGKDNFLYYRGERADLINWEVRDMGHREPPCEAQTFWDCLYSGCRRTAEGPINHHPRRSLQGDEDCYVLSLGSGGVYHRNTVVAMKAEDHRAIARYLSPMNSFGGFGLGEMLESGALYAPVEFLQVAFGAEISYASDGGQALASFPDGRKALFYSGSMLVRYDDAYVSMKKPCVQLCGAFYLPVGEFCGDLMGLCVSEADDCMLVSGHQAQLGRYTARILRRLLGGERRPIL